MGKTVMFGTFSIFFIFFLFRLKYARYIYNTLHIKIKLNFFD